MLKQKKSIIEYRSYEMRDDIPIQTHNNLTWSISCVPSARLHIHNCFEIGLCLSGRGYVRFGEEQLSFEQGDILCVGCNIPHTTWSDGGEESTWKYIHLDSDCIPDCDERQAVYNLYLNGHVLLKKGIASGISRTVTELIDEAEQRQTGYQTCIHGLCETLFVKLYRADSSNLQPSGSRASAVSVSPALDYISKHYMETFPQEKLASLCFMSPTHFRRKFHELLGTNPLSMLHQVRIMKSCALLRTTNINIYGIAEKVGYTSLSCYNRHFIELMGCTPSDWRNRPTGSAKTTVLEFSGWDRPETSEQIEQRNKSDGADT